jgi:hypothetical protein
MKKKVRVTKSSGNVFADIGLPNAAEHSIKADIVSCASPLGSNQRA